jgi:GYF domain 2
MADGWYLFDGTRQLGPLRLSELKHLLDVQGMSGVQVWRAGLEGWAAPSDLPELAPTGPPPLPTLFEARLHDGANDRIASKLRRRCNFIAMNWRGEFSLVTSYWLFGFLGNLFAGALALAVVAAFQSDGGYRPLAIFSTILLVWVAVIATAVWQTVGVWRSADRHIEARALLGKKSPWARVAKLAVFFGVIRLAGTFLSSGWPQLLETGRMTFLDDPDIPAYSIRVMRNGTEAEIAGGFKYGLTDDFVRILNASRQIKVVHLDSPGGRIGEAEKLNRIIRGKNLDTYVSSRCMSACTVAFAGGGHRILRRGAVLGFHAPSFPGMSREELADASQIQRDIFAAAGFDRSFVDRALSTPSTELWRPTFSELLQARAITAVSDGSDFALSGIGTALTKDDFGRMLRKALPLLAALKIRFPNDYDAVVQAYYASFQSGKTEVEAVVAGRTRLLVVLRKLRPLADDSVLSDIGAAYADQYRSLGSKSPALCYQYASGAGGTFAPPDLPQALIQRQSEIDRRVVETASARPAADTTASSAAWKKILTRLAGRGVSGEQFNLLSATTVPPEKYRDYCATATTLFSETSKLPPGDAGIIMRQILADK